MISIVSSCDKCKGKMEIELPSSAEAAEGKEKVEAPRR
jgi:hypothetical protein